MTLALPLVRPAAGPHRVEHARAEEFLRSLSDSSVDLIVTDPPYFRVKALKWDRAWDTSAGFLRWLGDIADEWARVLKPNGTLVCFAGRNPAATPGASMAARVEVLIADRLNVTASVTWVKENGRHRGASREACRSYFPQTEAAIIAEHYGADNIAKGEAGYLRACDELRGFVFEPLRAYLDGERERAGLSVTDVAEAWRLRTGAARRTGMAGHWFSRVQWALPTQGNYEWLRGLFNRGSSEHLRREYEDLRREYEDLRREYEDLRREYEDLRRPFDAPAGRHYTDAWTYPVVPARRGKHPCEKPREMAEDIVRQCSRPGAVVLDTFAGSGVFLAAAARLGRVAWGCDADEAWATHTAERVALAGGPR